MNKSEITTKINLDANTLLDLSGDDLRMLHKKVVVNKYLEEKTMNARKPVSAIAKELGISKSTLDRYKSETGLSSTRRNHEYSAARKREITMKAMATRKQNQMYKDELRSILSNKDMTKDEVDREFERLRSTYSHTNFPMSHTNVPMSESHNDPSSSRKSKPHTVRRGGKIDTVEDGDDEARAIARDIASKLNL